MGPSAADATVPAVATAAATCTDEALARKVAADFAALQTLTKGDPKLAIHADLGVTLVLLMKTRYSYEDSTPPAGCEAVNRVLGFVFEAAQDQFVANLAGQVDTANATNYDNFVLAAGAHGQTFGKFLESFFAIVPFSS